MATRAPMALVAQAYARALFNAARKLGEVERALEESRQVARILHERADFRAFLESPHIATEKKRALIDKAFAGKLSKLLMNTLYIMVDRERAEQVSDVLEAFHEMVEQFEGIWPATVTTARELGFQEKLTLKTALEKRAKCNLKIKYLVDPRVIGGVVFRFKDQLVDASLQSGLNELRKMLLGAPLAGEARRA